jgi:hypothetical protein
MQVNIANVFAKATTTAMSIPSSKIALGDI